MDDDEELLLALLAVCERTDDPEARRLAFDRLLAQREGKGAVEMALGTWERYRGPRGGLGWRDPVTGEVTYQEERPGGGGAPKPAQAAAGADAPAPAGPKGLRQKALDLLAAGKARLTAAGKAAYDRLPGWARKVVDWGQAAEHALEGAYNAGRELAVEVARERGLSDEHADRVGRVLAWADGIQRWTTNIPAAHEAIHTLAHIGGPVAFVGAKAGYYVPVASLAYVGYSMARAAAGGRNPVGLVRAARERLKARKGGGNGGH